MYLQSVDSILNVYTALLVVYLVNSLYLSVEVRRRSVQKREDSLDKLTKEGEKRLTELMLS